MMHVDAEWAKVRRALVCTSTVVFAVCVVAGFFLFFVPISSAAICMGNVITSFKSKVIRHLEGGIVSSISVHEGDVVQKGQQLVVVDVNKVSEDMETIQEKLKISSAELLRLGYQKTEKEFVWSEDLGIPLEAYQSEVGVMDLELKAYKSKKDVIQIDIEKLTELIQHNRDRQKILADKAKILEEELRNVRQLLKTSNSTKQRLFSVQRDLKTTMVEQNSILSQLHQNEKDLASRRVQLHQVDIEYSKELGDRIGKLDLEITALTNELASLQDVHHRRVVRSPVKGVVSDIQVLAVGQVIKPSDPLLQIIPTEDDLIIEAYLKPSDIDAVRIDMPVKINFTSYQQKVVPRFDGVLTYVDYNISTNDSTGDQYYKIKVQFNRADLEGMALYPGMPVDVYLITGRRTFAEIILYPILSQIHKSFREE